MANGKQPTDPETQGGLVQYRLEGKWLEHAIPDFYTLHRQEENQEKDILCLVNKQSIDTLDKKQEVFLAERLRCVDWQAVWRADWAERTSNDPEFTADFQAWVQYLASHLTPHLPQLYAQLLAFYLPTTSDCPTSIKVADAVIPIGALHCAGSTAPNGVSTICIRLDDPALTPLVNCLEDCVKHNHTFFSLFWAVLGPRLWVDYTAEISLAMEVDLGLEALTAMSSDELNTMFYAYESDGNRFHDEIIPLVSGYMHVLVRNAVLAVLTALSHRSLLRPPHWQRLEHRMSHAFISVARDHYLYALVYEAVLEMLTMLITGDRQVFPEPTSADALRLAAVTGIADRLGPPMSSQRRKLVSHELARRAAQHQRSPEVELRKLTTSILFELIASTAPGTFSHGYRTLRSRLNDRLTRELLDDPHWRQRWRVVPLDAAQKALVENPSAVIETWLSVGQALSRASLTPRESQIIHAMLQGERPQEIASRLGLHPVTVRVHFHNAHQKIAQYV